MNHTECWNPNSTLQQNALTLILCQSEMQSLDDFRKMSGEGLLRFAEDRYTYFLNTISDPRVSSWPLMDSPIPTLAMVVTYLYLAVFFGPRLMANRKPFKLNNLLIIYNAAQVVFSALMLWEHLMSGWFLDYSYKCQPVDYTYNPTAMRMANLCWWYYISKLTEFVDTLFFVLRKKDNQISLLHLYHHSLTPIETWICVKFLAGGHGTFSNLINNIVHVIMYFYYMMSAMGPQYQKYLWWKKYLTTLQLSQFILVFVHSAQVLVFNCDYPKLVASLLLVHSTIFFALFFDFYQQAYKRSQKSQSQINGKTMEANGKVEMNGKAVTNGKHEMNGNGVANGKVLTNGKLEMNGNGLANGKLLINGNGLTNGKLLMNGNGTTMRERIHSEHTNGNVEMNHNCDKELNHNKIE